MFSSPCDASPLSQGVPSIFFTHGMESIAWFYSSFHSWLETCGFQHFLGQSIIPLKAGFQNVGPNVGKEKDPEKGENVPNDWFRAMLLSSHPTQSPLFLGPLSIVVVIFHGSRALAQRTGVAMPQHVFHQTMHGEHMSTHGGFRPHHRLQADWTLFDHLEGGRRPVVCVYRIHQRLSKRHPPIKGLGVEFVPNLQGQVVQFGDAILFPNEIRVDPAPLLGQLFHILLIKLTGFNLHPHLLSHIGHMRRIVSGMQLFQVLDEQILVRQVEREGLGRLQGHQTMAKVL
ncbi:hypothetical protein NPIL_519231 [Nephila pilipes]|uniref:Uncharacterized protein n=1 Tax=Nephila pilipes TaxID=299642 RepID=A0A8X6NGV3_NEPPI|nr:hypothetical protein NPIL_519231 [Nephila pilipes]